jgi:hypothetical protein
MEERIKLIIDGNDKYLLPEEIQKEFDALNELLSETRKNVNNWWKKYQQEWDEKMEAYKTMRLLLTTGEKLFTPYTKQLQTLKDE